MSKSKHLIRRQRQKKNVTQAIKNVAKKLGNRPAICRKDYVHSGVIDAYLEGTLAQMMQQCTQQNLANSLYCLQPEELAAIALLEQHLAQP